MTLRQEARILAVQILYSLEMSEGQTERSPEQLGDLLGKEFDAPTKYFVEILVKGVEEDLQTIDDLIADHLQNWTLERLSRVDLSILRLSVYSLLHQKDIPPKVVIDEGIKVAKKISSAKSYGFINGVLHAISNHISIWDGEAHQHKDKQE